MYDSLFFLSFWHASVSSAWADMKTILSESYDVIHPINKSHANDTYYLHIT